MKSVLEGINSRITEAEEWISNLEDRVREITAAEQNKEKQQQQKNDEYLRNLWDNIKCTTVLILRVPDRKERKKGFEKIFEEITAENFPNLGKETAT